MPEISVDEFVNFFKYYNDEPHQQAGVKELYRYLDLISKDETSSWIKIYREGPKTEAPVKVADEVYVTKAQLASVWECSADLIHDYEIDEMNSCLEKYEITTPARIRHFLSQTAHESGGGRYKKELASGVAYEFRDDLGNTSPGDGPKYKGAGYIQLTGKYNYSRLSEYLNDPRVMEGVDYVAENLPFTSAGYWWEDNKMNELIDSGADVLAVTKRVNGGTHHLSERQRYYDICLRVI
jgi:putative chitinase